MPELPEVTTTVNGLKKVLPGLRILDIWTDLAKKKVSRKDFERTIKNEKFFKYFRENTINKKILSVERRAKNILIHISGGRASTRKQGVSVGEHTILIHMKMTGHLLFGEYVRKVEYGKQKVIREYWEPKNKKSALNDPYNRFIHFVFKLSNGKHLAFSDSRKFGKITLLETKNHLETIHLKHLGPEPLERNFEFKEFKKVLYKKEINKNKPIKQVLLDQSVIAGIGNIYSDEMLWLSSINPKSITDKIPEKQLKLLFKNMKSILKKGIDFGGDSMSDYRNIYGARGNFQNHHNVYRKNNKLCGKKNCTGGIIKEVVSGRSTHFCNKHQKLYL